MEEFNLSRTRLAAFAAAWVLFGVLLSFLLVSSWAIAWKHALAFALPMSALAQGIGWAAQYPTRSTPLARTRFGRLLITHTVAAIIMSLLWVTAGGLLASWLETSLGWTGTTAQFQKMKPQFYSLGFAYYLLSVAFHYVLLAQQASGEAQKRELEFSVRARDAELSALKAQINPHFLYNSLNSISALTSIDPGRAREMCVLLADFLRMTLGLGEKTLIPLQEELDLLDRYCAIEKVRFGSRLSVEQDIDEAAKSCFLPPLLLQPLFENAIVHGIAQLSDGGWIRLVVRRHDKLVVVTVENRWDPEAVSSRRKNGVGLRNVQRRLEARYGKEAHVDARAEEELFRVQLRFPAEVQEGVSA